MAIPLYSNKPWFVFMTSEFCVAFQIFGQGFLSRVFEM